MKILTIANRKGGAGKSTCAAHLACEAVKSGLTVILVDLDPQKTLESWWQTRKENDIAFAEISEGIDQIFERLKASDFDLCIVDTPGDMSQNAVFGINAADLVLIPSKPTSPDLGAIGRTINVVEQCKKKFVFVITQGIIRSKATFQASSALSSFGAVAPSVIANRVSYAEAMGRGGNAGTFDKNVEEEMSSVWCFLRDRLFDNKKTSKQKLVV